MFEVSLAPLDSVDSIVPTIAEALGFRFFEEGEPQQQLLDYLHQKRLLLVMDNFEHLGEGAALVTELRQTAAEVKILATSRVRLNVQGEHPFAVAGMSFPDREIDEDGPATVRSDSHRPHLPSGGGDAVGHPAGSQLAGDADPDRDRRRGRPEPGLFGV